MPTNPRKVWRDKWHEKRPRTSGLTASSEATKPVATSSIPTSGLQVASLPVEPSQTPILPTPKSWNNNTVMTEQTRTAVSPLFGRYEQQPGFTAEAPRQTSPRRKTYPSSQPPASLPHAISIGDPYIFDSTELQTKLRAENTDEGPLSRASRPKLTRYISDYLTFGVPIISDFSEPWSERAPLDAIMPVDPCKVVQSVRIHAQRIPPRPLPVEHISGLLRVFEEYEKIKREAAQLQEKWRQTLVDFVRSEDIWLKTKTHYQAEIKRLELMIAKGESGMSDLIKVRQGATVKRARPHRKSLSTDQAQSVYRYLSPEQLDDEIRLRSQQVRLQRPTSPSENMAALSRHLSNAGLNRDFCIGPPSYGEREATLSRKVKSEQDLTRMGQSETSSQDRDVHEKDRPGQCVSTSGEKQRPGAMAIDPAIESEAFVALKGLAILVARRKGINPQTFTTQLMDILSISAMDGSDDSEGEQRITTAAKVQYTPEGSLADLTDQVPGSSPQSDSLRMQGAGALKQRRHFSFEPGDDRLQGLNEAIKGYELREELEAYKINRPKSQAGSQSTRSSDTRSPSPNTDTVGLASGHLLNVDTQKPSKIPSPIQEIELSMSRRQSSRSSLRTRYHSGSRGSRRISGSSVVTAIHRGSIEQIATQRADRSYSNLGLSPMDSSQAARMSDSSVDGVRSPNSTPTASSTVSVDKYKKSQAENAKPAKKSTGTRRSGRKRPG